MQNFSHIARSGAGSVAPASTRCRTPSRELVVCAAQNSTAQSQQTRRALLSSGFAAFLLLPAQQAQAGFGWDGSSSALGSCALGDEGADCRRQLLLKDKALETTAYPSTQQRQGSSPQAITSGIPIAEMSDAYTRETVALGDVVEKYFTLDPFDPERTKIVKTIKTDGAAWASKYARGGSARKQSARKFYIVVDALQGHITSNGFAPLPPSKVRTLQKNVEETKALLAKGV